MEKAAYTMELQAGAPEGRRCAKPAPGTLSSTLHTKPSCSVCCSIARKTKRIHANLKLGRGGYYSAWVTISSHALLAKYERPSFTKALSFTTQP